MKKILLSLLTLSTILLYSCKEEKEECDEVPCFAIFNSSVVTLKDTSDQPVILDRFTVTILPDITIITKIDSTLNNKGTYNLIEDGVIGKNDLKEVVFAGFINEEEVVQQTYIVQTDCCSYQIIRGDLKLVLERY